MKKLLYFLIGLSLVIFPFRYAYSVEQCQAVQECAIAGFEAYAATTWPTFTPEFKGTFATNTLASAYITTLKTTANCAQGWGGTSTRTVACPTTYIYYVQSLGTVCNKIYYTVVCEGTYTADTDGDGLDDDCDAYPNDNTPYLTAVIFYQVLISSGATTYQQFKTDRGDIFERGTKHLSDPLYRDYLSIAPVLKDPLTYCASTLSAPTEQTPIDYETQIDNFVNDQIDSTAIPTVTTIIPPTSEPKTGTETDNEALRKIVGNTDATNQGITNITKYLSDINNSVKSIKLGTTLSTVNNMGSTTTSSGTVGGALETTQQTISTKLDTIAGKIPDAPTQSDVTSSISSVGNTDTAYDSTVGALGETLSLDDAPTEYKTKTSISTKMTEYLSNNPINGIINGSGVTLTGSQPYLSWTYNGTPVLLRVDLYDSALDAFGSILLAMTGLSGLIMLFTRS